MDPLSARFDQFLAERRYLKNVTPKTLIWYRTAFHAFAQIVPCDQPLVERADLHRFIIALRDRGVRPVSCNTWAKGMNAFFAWLHAEGHAPILLKVPLQRVERRVIAILSDTHLRHLLSTKPRTFAQWRLYALLCLIIDTGVRIDETLTLRTQDLSLDDLMLTVFGKGRKERRVPFSVELRKVLFRYLQVRLTRVPFDLVFGTRHGTAWGQRNSLHGLHRLQDRLGIPRCGWHRLRHTFATNYLRAGGDVVRLSKMLGHTQFTTTQRYIHMLSDDLIETQQRTSLLNRLRR